MQILFVAAVLAQMGDLYTLSNYSVHYFSNFLGMYNIRHDT